MDKIIMFLYLLCFICFSVIIGMIINLISKRKPVGDLCVYHTEDGTYLSAEFYDRESYSKINTKEVTISLKVKHIYVDA